MIQKLHQFSGCRRIQAFFLKHLVGIPYLKIWCTPLITKTFFISRSFSISWCIIKIQDTFHVYLAHLVPKTKEQKEPKMSTLQLVNAGCAYTNFTLLSRLRKPPLTKDQSSSPQAVTRKTKLQKRLCAGFRLGSENLC